MLNEQLESYRTKCIGFVVMPKHVHAVIWLSQTGQLSRFMHGWRRMSSFRIREWYREHVPEYFAEFGEGDRFWQPKYYAFEIYERAKLEEKLTYMHQNPVRAGFVQNAS